MYTISRSSAIIRISCCFLLATALGCGRSTTPDEDHVGAVELKTVTADEVVERIKQLPGKIVVVDTWASWCPPCRDEFPEFVRIHERHKGTGVVCMSVSIDDAAKNKDAAKFLQDANATFLNFRISDAMAWTDRWKIQGIPVCMVFRDGELLKKFDRDDPAKMFKYADVDKFVGELVAQGK